MPNYISNNAGYEIDNMIDSYLSFRKTIKVFAPENSVITVTKNSLVPTTLPGFRYNNYTLFFPKEYGEYTIKCTYEKKYSKEILTVDTVKVYEVVFNEDSFKAGYIVFSSSDPFTLSLSPDSGTGVNKNWDGNIYYTQTYSEDASDWTVWDGTGSLSSGSTNELYLRGYGNSHLSSSNSSQSYTNFVLNGTSKIECHGNINSLLDYDKVLNNEQINIGVRWCFYRLFYDCTLLKTAPDLPATSLYPNCYQSMFEGCTSLTAAPALPATSTTSGVSIPSLPYNCYYSMFEGCTALTTAPALPATSLDISCYSSMFKGCTHLIAAPTLPATTLAQACYSGMFYNCKKLTTLPDLPAIELFDSCYSEMFRGCTAIKISDTFTPDYTIPYRIPTEGTGTEGTDSLMYMFRGTGGPFNNPGTPTINATYYLPGPIPYVTFSGNGTSSTFNLSLKNNFAGWDGTIEYSTDASTWTVWDGTSTLTSNSDKELYLRGTNNRRFSDGTNTTTFVITTNTGEISVDLFGNIENLLNYQTVANGSHPTMYSYCFYKLFENCTSLRSAFNLTLPATTLTDHCYNSMFLGCNHLQVPPALRATTLATGCYQSMFYGCINLIHVPLLPATTLTDYCYAYMFYNCSKLEFYTEPYIDDNSDFRAEFRVSGYDPSVVTSPTSEMLLGTKDPPADTPPSSGAVYYTNSVIS